MNQQRASVASVSCRRQTGLSFFSLLIVVIVLACAGVLIAQVIPTVIEYQAVVKAVRKAKSAGGPQEIRSQFDKYADVENIKSITGKELEVVRQDDGFAIRFAYEREIHMVGPAYLLLKYRGDSGK